MKNNLSKAAIAVLGVGSLLALTACGSTTATSSANGPVDITFWSSGPTGTGFNSLLKGFNNTYKGKYQVDFKQIPYANETELVTSALTDHKEPDILEESLTPSATYAYDGLEEPIGPILKSVGINPSVDFPASMWNGTTVNGVHYVAPTDALPTVLFYNKALFKKAGLNPNDPPTTGAQFVADAEKLTVPSQKQWGFVEEPLFNTWTFPSLLAQYGGHEANASTRKVEFNSAAGLQALTVLYNTIFKWHVSPKGASPNEYISLFVDGKDAMSMSGTFNVAPFRQALGKNLGVAPLPKFGSREADFLGQNYWWVFKTPTMNAKTQKAVGVFMKYMYDHSMVLASQDGLFPTWEPTMKNPSFIREFSMPVQEASVRTGVLNPLIPNWGTTSTDSLYSTMDEALLGKMSPKEALSQASSTMQKVVSQLAN